MEASPLLALEQITFRQEGRTLFEGLDLAVFPGETVILSGPNGSGKSTLLRVCVGLVQPEKGTVRIKGVALSGLNERQLTAIRAEVGFVFQSGGLLSNMTLLDNVTLPIRYHQGSVDAVLLEKIDAELEEMGLLPLKKKFPFQVSAAEVKFISLLRASVLRPAVLFIDEPLWGLDPSSGTKMIGRLTRFKEEGRTLIVTTSNPASMKGLSDRVLMLQEGRVVEQEKHP